MLLTHRPNSVNTSQVFGKKITTLISLMLPGVNYT